MTLNSKRKQFAAKVKEKLTTVFTAERLEPLARQSGFLQRASSKITGRDFVELMTTAMLEEATVSLGGLCDRLQQLHPQAAMTPQALHQRLNTPQAVAYLHEVLQLALREHLAPVCAHLPGALLAPFGRVLLEDSTQCRLHEKLAETFKGSGGSASTAVVKIDVIYDVTHHLLQELYVTDGKAADQGRAAAILPHLRADDLVVRDLGYFSLDVLGQIATKQAYFLSRLSPSAMVYPSAEPTVPALMLVDHVQQHAGQHAVVDLAVYVGHARLPCRLVAYRLPAETVEQRQRSAYETARKKGRTPTQAYLTWLQFGWYITNVRPAVWVAEVVVTVYRLRWQIELLFKQWKSLLALHVLRGTRPERIKCLLYGRLITIAMMTMVSSYASWYAGEVLQRELSGPKLINWLKRTGRFAQAMHSGTVDALFQALRHTLPRLLCKQKRRRKTTYQLLAEEADSLEMARAA
jgi:hypothetical protein